LKYFNENHQPEHYGLDCFVREMTKMLESTESDAVSVVKAERLLSKLIQTLSWLPTEKQQPSDEGYARHTLYVDPEDRFEVIALVWQPGQRTSLHDHDGTWGAEGVLVGCIRVTNYVQTDVIASDVVKLRKTGTVVISRQCTGQLLPPADCHILETEGDQMAITVHVYGKQLRKFRVFDPLEEEGLYIAREHRVGYQI
jgi:3-mercaptopropionate dioxygenase